MGEVRRKGNRPLYVQIKEILEKDIRKGVFQPGERFPTERELCERFGVSRITIRQALQELVKDGLLYRHQGSGSYVTYPSPVRKKELYVVVPEEFWIPPLRKAVRDYHNGHPGERLRVKVLVMGGPEFHAEIVDAVGKGEAPDMALIDWIRLTEFADMRYIEPLDELDAEWVESFKADILPIFAENSSYQGHFWGVQIDTTLAVLWYRKDIL
ncbi:MAG TPA: GntR family transcriptional regulator, partial [Candidatus Acetothermia bacterium]|nr:GntR family transcriptional regulator [Candidatus Acetothermia bacterium]